jgi:hypothetical protein
MIIDTNNDDLIIDTNNDDLMLGLDFFIKIKVIIDVKKGTIQVRQGPRNNIQILPLNMGNMLQMVKEKVKPKSNANEKDTMELMELGYIKWISLGICKFFMILQQVIKLMGNLTMMHLKINMVNWKLMNKMNYHHVLTFTEIMKC